MKKYTRKQIIEAIDYWQKKLNQLNESKSKLLDALELKYGYDIVFNDQFNFNLQEFKAYEIYEIINRILFNNQLDQIPVYCWSYKQICIELKHRKSKTVPINSFYGIHSVILENEPNEITEITKLNLRDSIIMLNMDLITRKASFAFAVSCLCHEMIHYYDEKFGQYETMIKYEIIHNINIDSHTTPTFIEFKNKAIKMYLDIIDTGNGLDFETINRNASHLAISALSESDMEKIKNNKNMHISNIKGPTGYCINDFD